MYSSHKHRRGDQPGSSHPLTVDNQTLRSSFWAEPHSRYFHLLTSNRTQKWRIWTPGPFADQMGWTLTFAERMGWDVPSNWKTLNPLHFCLQRLVQYCLVKPSSPVKADSEFSCRYLLNICRCRRASATRKVAHEMGFCPFCGFRSANIWASEILHCRLVQVFLQRAALFCKLLKGAYSCRYLIVVCYRGIFPF